VKPIIIENSKIPKYLSIFIDIWAITLYPFIICRGEMNSRTLNHEKIHLAQQAELLLIGFYFLYAYWWLKYRVFYGFSSEEAYHALPFEGEAYGNEMDMEYLNKRKHFAWRQY
tara:strand:- start:260 stop:598 length:339 start_codon:yes stop_codon:yes gene_type:complete